MPVNLPTELLRSLAAIVDSGSMLKATERVFVTQSALSLQMKRLEEIVQTPLFQREGRRLALTPAGEHLLAHAREILAANDRAVAAMNGGALAGPVRIGLIQDFAETLLAGVLARFVSLHAETQMQVRVAGSHELMDLLEADRLDFVLGVGAPDDPARVRAAPMLWLGAADLLEQEVLPLAILEKPCRFRMAALEALDRAGIAYRIMLETPSLSALRAAVEAGLGLTVRTELLLGGRTEALFSDRLPLLPEVAYVLHVRRSPHPTIERLAELVRAAAAAL